MNIKDIKKGTTVIKKTFSIDVKAVNDEERRITFVISTNDQDRSEDIIIPKGIDFTDYLTNPVVPYGHNYGGKSYGRGENLRVEGNKVIGDVVFPPEGDFPDADIVYKLYKNKFQHAVSIGFIPIDYELNPKSKYGIIYTKISMLEFSLVLVPDNPKATRLKSFLEENCDDKELIEKILNAKAKAADDGTGEGNSEGEDDAADNEDEVPENMQVTEMTASHITKIVKSAMKETMQNMGTGDDDFDTGKSADAVITKAGAEFSQENYQTIQKAITGMRKHAAAVNAHADMLEKMIKADPKNDDTDENIEDPSDTTDADDSENPEKSQTFRLVRAKEQKLILNLVEVVKAVDKIAGKGLKDFNKAK